jgi:hypothetical protein
MNAPVVAPRDVERILWMDPQRSFSLCYNSVSPFRSTSFSPPSRSAFVEGNHGGARDFMVEKAFVQR